MDSGACTTTTTATSTDPDLQHASLDLRLNLDVSMDLGDGPADTDADAHRIEDVVVPQDLKSFLAFEEIKCPSPHPLLRTHDHSSWPMLGFVVPEHDSAGVELGHAHTNPDRDFLVL
jgi:hypothetical protein